MGDPLKKVRAGDRLEIPAPAYNAFVDAATYVRQQQNGGVLPQADEPAAGTVLVRNDSGASVSKFHVLGITGVVFSPAASERHAYDEPVLTVGVPAAGQEGKFVIMDEPLQAGQVGRAWVDGVCWVKTTAADEAEEAYGYAERSAGTTSSLALAASGSARVLWRAAGTGAQWSVVRLGGGAAVIDSPRTVKVYKDGPEVGTVPLDGSGGYDSSTGLYHTCSYTYEVREVDGTTVIATEQTPEHARMSSTKYVAATAGTLGLWDPVTSKLLIVYKERPSTRTDCP
jgi:hypothetical protein